MAQVSQKNSWPRLTGFEHIAQSDVILNTTQTPWSWFSNTGRGFVITQGAPENKIMFTVETCNIGRRRTFFDAQGQPLFELDRHRRSVKNAWVARRPKRNDGKTAAAAADPGESSVSQATASDKGIENGADEIVMIVSYNVWTHIHITMDVSFPKTSLPSDQRPNHHFEQQPQQTKQGDAIQPVSETFGNHVVGEAANATPTQDIRIRCKDWFGVRYDVTCGDDILMTAKCETTMPGWLSGYKMTQPKFTIEVKQGMDLTLAAALAVCISDSYSELRIFML